ncbi:MAG: adenylate/guanylate cyclase domain-containing protein [Candidatus Kariarchaeaceae archaeon]|jgi:predicted ATPase/class 3 adenylate cyclase
MKEAEKAGGMQNERRIVTMLFCDLQGSTAAAEQLDPEEWVEIMNGAFAYLIEPVYRYEGVIARLMGDAILAFFGAPIAHEDDPERAVLSGIDIIENIKPYLAEIEQKWGIEVNVRVGINTGLVVVGEMGSDLRVEYTAMGDAINLAARMESTAEPGTIQVTEYTYKLIKPIFDVDELGPLEVKGKVKPIKTYRVLRKKEQRELLRGLKGLDSPLVGRDEEFDVIMAKIGEMMTGKGQIISTIAEAGIGKSRLVRDIKEQLLNEGRLRISNMLSEGDENRILWLEGVSLSYQSTAPYTPFKVILTKYLGLEQITDNTEKYMKLKRVLLNNQIDEDFCPYIAKMIDINPVGEDKDRVLYLDPPALRAKIFEICHKLFTKWCENAPLVMVLDDVHWIDNSSQELLKALFSLAETGKILFILMFRPRREEPSWEIHEHLIRKYNYIYTPLELTPLDPSQARFLVFNILKIEGLSEEVRNLILDKSEGNPFFLEEVIRAMIDQNMIERDGNHWREVGEIEDISIPDTVAGVLTTRLDQLDEQLKRTLQTAAVIGREFKLSLLSQLVDDSTDIRSHLIELEKRELIISVHESSEPTFLFKHPLTQESAYNSLLMKKRRELHNRIAHTLEKEVVPKVIDIAHHFYEAREFDHAIPYLIKSGDEAFQSYASEEAIQHYKRAESILNEDTDVMKIHDLYQGLGQTYLLLGQAAESIQAYQNLLSIAEARDHVECKVNAHNQLGFVKLFGLGELDGAINHLSVAEELATAADYQFGIAQNYMIMCNVETVSAQFESVEQHLKIVAEIGEELEESNTMLYGRSHITNTLFYTARYDQAIEYGEETLLIAKEHDNKAYISELLSNSLSMSYFMTGEIDVTWKQAMEAYQLSSQISMPTYIVFAATTLAEVCLSRGHYEEAQNYIMIALELSHQLPISGFRLFPLSCELYMLMDLKYPKDRVDEVMSQIETLIQDPFGGFLASKYQSIRGHYHLRQGELEQAEEYFRKVLDVPGTLMHVYEPHAKIGLVGLYLAQNKLDLAQAQLADLEQILVAKNINLLYPEFALISSHVYLASGKRDEAIEILNKGIEKAEKFDFAPTIYKLHAALLQIVDPSDTQVDLIKQKMVLASEKISNRFMNEDLKETYLRSINTESP